ncbi:MAG: alpha/beta hydrolase [Hyphomicrobiaceae bacterium]
MLKRYPTLTIVLAMLGAVAFYLGASFFIVSNSLAARPAKCAYVSPALANFVMEELELKSAEDHVPLSTWLLHPQTPSDRVVILIHGFNSFAWDAAAPDISRALLDAGFHVLVFDLRAHGRSGGDRHGLGWHEKRDVRAAVDTLVAKGFHPGSIGVHGTSYGAVTALLATAAIAEIGAVVSDSAFSDIRDIMDREIEIATGLPTAFAQVLRPGIALMARLFFDLDLEVIRPSSAISKIKPRPIFLIHGQDDKVVPASHGFELHDVSRNPRNEFWIIPGLGHTEAVRLNSADCAVRPSAATRSVYLNRIVAFFEKMLKPEPR